MPASVSTPEVLNPPSVSLKAVGTLGAGAVLGAAAGATAITLLWDTSLIMAGGFVIPLLALTVLLTGAVTGAAAAIHLTGQG